MIPRVWFVIITILIIFSSPLAGGAATPSNVVVMGKSLDDLITLDPAEAFEFSGTEIIGNLYDRLFLANPKNPAQPIGGLVESWSISKDGLQYEFLLKTGPKFHDGSRVLSDDVVFSLKRAIVLNKTPSFIVSQLGLSIENMDVRLQTLDPRKFVLILGKAYSPSLVLNILSSTVTSVVNREAVLEKATQGDWGYKWLRSHSAGSGPFRVNRWNVGEYVILDKNDQHPKATGIPNRIIIRDIREPATQRLMLSRKDIDIARNLLPDQIEALSNEPGIVTRSAPQARIFYIGLNQAIPALAVPGVQQAIRYGIDYTGIVENLLPGQAEVHQNFLPSGFLGSLTESPFAFDLPRARNLLVEAGYGDGLSIRVDVRSDPLALQIAQALQTSFSKIGITMELRPGDGKQILTRYRARRHEMYIGYWGADYLDPHSNAAAFVYNWDNSNKSANKTLAWRNGWETRGLNERVDSALLIGDPFVRAEAYGKLQRIVRSDSPFIFIFQEKALVAMQDYIENFKLGLTSDQVRYENIKK